MFASSELMLRHDARLSAVLFGGAPFALAGTTNAEASRAKVMSGVATFRMLLSISGRAEALDCGKLSQQPCNNKDVDLMKYR